MPRRLMRCTVEPCVGRVLVITPKGVEPGPQTCGSPNCPQKQNGTRGFGQQKGKGKR